MWAAKILIRLGGCPGWSESSLGLQPFCWFCHVTAQLWIGCAFPHNLNMFLCALLDFGLSLQYSVSLKMETRKFLQSWLSEMKNLSACFERIHKIGWDSLYKIPRKVLTTCITMIWLRQENLVLIAYASSESRETFRQKARSLAPSEWLGMHS